MSIFWTTPDHALSFGARALGIALLLPMPKSPKGKTTATVAARPA